MGSRSASEGNFICFAVGLNIQSDSQRTFYAVFSSMKVHRGELTTMDGGVGYPLFDLTSSGLNRGHPEWRFDRSNRHRIGTMQWGNNFGMIALEWDREDLRIRFQIIDEEGDIAIQRKINLSTLQPGVIQ